MSKDTVDPRLFDVRCVERNIKRGLITRKDYEKHLKSLADVKDRSGNMDESKKGGGD